MSRSQRNRQGEPSDQPQHYGGHAVVMGAMSTFIVLGMASGLIGATLPGIETTFAISHQAAGLLFLSTLIGYLPAGPLVGWLARRYSAPAMILAALILTALVLIARATTPTWAVFVCWGIGEGFALGVLGTAVNLYGAQHFSARQMSWLHAAFGAGMIASPALMWYVQSHHLAWHAIYIVIACAALMVAALVALTASAWRPDDTLHSQGQVMRQPLLVLLRKPVAWLLIGIVLCYPLESIIARWGYTLLAAESTLQLRQSSMTIISFWTCFTIGRIGSGLVARRMSAERLLGLSTGGVVVGALLLQLPLGAPGLLLSLTILGVALAPIYPLLISQVPQRLGRALTPTAIGLLVCVGSIGGTAWSSLTGMLASVWGLAALRAEIGVLAGVFFCLIVAWLLSKRSDPIHDPASDTDKPQIDQTDQDDQPMEIVPCVGRTTGSVAAEACELLADHDLQHRILFLAGHPFRQEAQAEEHVHPDEEPVDDVGDHVDRLDTD